jgi:DDE superfamily endonuclease
MMVHISKHFNCRAWTNFKSLEEVKELFDAVWSSVQQCEGVPCIGIAVSRKRKQSKRSLHVAVNRMVSDSSSSDSCSVEASDSSSDEEVEVEDDDSDYFNDWTELHSTLKPIDQCLAALFYLCGIHIEYMKLLLSTYRKNFGRCYQTMGVLARRGAEGEHTLCGEVQQSMPKQFKEQKFEKCRLIIDGFDIDIQVPKRPDYQAAAYSQYRKYHGFKFILGITPRGDVAYISPGFSSRATDVKVFRESGMLDLLQPGDATLADKGCMMQGDCADKNLHLYLPVFQRNDQQFAADENEYTAKVANCSIYVENAIGRLRKFKVLQSHRFKHTDSSRQIQVDRWLLVGEDCACLRMVDELSIPQQDHFAVKGLSIIN